MLQQSYIHVTVIRIVNENISKNNNSGSRGGVEGVATIPPPFF